MSLSDFSLENKVALITGGTSGLGKMMALALAKAGAFVWIASSRDNADETLQEIKQQGSNGSFVQVDVTSSDALEKIVSKISRELEELGQSEIQSSIIGRKVMDELKELDKIAYIRFASVYTNFKEIGEFGEYIDELHGKPKKK